MKLLSQIKGDLEFNRNLYNLIDALGKIAVTQYYILEKENKLYEAIFGSVTHIRAMIDSGACASSFMHPSNLPECIIAVTSDSGLLGGLNMQVMSLAVRELNEHSGRLIVVGDRGKAYAGENGIAFTGFKGVNDEMRFSQAQQLRDYVIEEIARQRCSGVKIIYPHPLSIVSQKVRLLALLPFEKTETESAAHFPEIISESSADDILGYLAYIYLGNKFYEIFGLSRLAEMSARFVHLENSKTKIEQLNKQLRLQYFRQKHELTDRSMRELFTARLAFKESH